KPAGGTAGKAAGDDPGADLLHKQENGDLSSKDSDRQLRLRLCVLNEILNTERDYVRNLAFLQSAFLQRIRQTAENQQCLTPEQVKILFSNIEFILEVHYEFLSTLDASLQPEPQAHHSLGHVFLKFRDRFSVYGEYCSNHEKALRLLMELNKIPHVRTFLLHLMLLGGKKSTDVPLEGYLLSPIQRICKYPLLLKELLKRTSKKHSDYPAVEGALQAMKAVCCNINETKRQMEKLEALEILQSHIEGWEGTNLTDICTELLLQGNLLKISAGNIQERVFFLFDNLLVYGKRKSRLVSGKKSTKRTKSINGPQYVFRGRINTEVMEVENVEDGTADYHSNNYTVTNGWKIHNTAKNKWFVCMAKNAEDKQKWLDAILKEREQRESLKLGMERDAYVMIAEKGEKLYHMMMTKSRHLIKDRRRKLTIVPKCFLGNEFVSWLLESGEISKAEEGINLGQALLENGIIHHVSDKHQFKNEQVLYRFRYDDGTYKARSEMEDIISKGVRLYCRLHSLFTPVIKDRDHHLKTFKSVIPASKLVEWLVSQGDSTTREDAVTLGVGLCNAGFMHHVLEKSEFKDESQFFRFYADEETEGTSSKSKQLRSDFKLIENILAKSLVIHPEEEDYGFEIEEKNKAIIVKSVTRGSYAEMAGLQPGRKIYSINEDLVFLRPFSEVETMINQSFCIRRLLRLLVATKNKEIVKIPDVHGTLPFVLCGSCPPYVHAVKKGSEAAAAGLQPGQCVLKVNGNNMNQSSYQEVLEHFSGHQPVLDCGQWAYRVYEDVEEQMSFRGCENGSDSEDGSVRRLEQLSISGDVASVSLNVDNVHVEHGVVYEYVSTAGIKHCVLEKMVEPKGCFNLAAKILEAFVKDDSLFVKSCRQLMAQNEKVVTMPQFEFRNICDTKLESIEKRICSYKQFVEELQTKAWPTFKQASTKPHVLGCMDFVPINCHLNLMQVSCPKNTSSAGRAFSIRFGRKNSFFGLDPDQANLNPMSHAVHCVTSMAAPSWSCLSLDEETEEGEGSIEDGRKHVEGGLSFLLKQEDMESQDNYICLYNRLDISVREMKQYVAQIDVLLSSITGPTPPQGSEPPSFESAPSTSPIPEETDQDKSEHGGNKRVCFKVNEDDQEDSGHDTMSYRDSYSECNSNRDSVLSYTSVRSNSSYLGSDEMGSGDELPCDMQIPFDKQDKLHGCLEHLFNQVDSINSLLKGPIMSKACEETKHFHNDHSQPEFRHTDDWTARWRYVLHKNIQEDPWNLSQLLLALLKCTDTELQLRRDVIFCQSLVGALCALAEQLVNALNLRFNNNGEYEEDSKEVSRKWLEQIATIGVLFDFQSTLSPHVREERIMLEDTKAALQDLEKVTVLFRPLENECLVPNTSVHYQVEGSRQAIRVTMFLDSCHFSELPTRLQNGGSLKLQSVLFTRGLEKPEGVLSQDFVAMEEFQQCTNALSLEKVKGYYRKLRYIWPSYRVTFLLRPLNTLDDLCRLMQKYMNVKPGSAGQPSGVSVLVVSSELCNRLGACHITMCATGMQRCTLTVSLEQAVTLSRNHGLMPRCLMQTMDIMRKQGTRVEISAKNLRVMDQMPPCAPRLFRLCLPPSDGDL
uniref:Phosphatidylinositol 3,4,5-trisphosphate-dependent Rac exchanger 1 protein-like n=1 Tax=Sinocyclocheilus rhinocerous TaxID=307959 RepID=A0A673N1U4_9TELE